MNTHSMVTALSAEKRALLEKHLLQKGLRTASPQPSFGGPRPLSFSQESLWFLDQLEPGSPLYNIGQAVRLRGELHIESLRQSLEKVIERHEALRTNFILVDDEPMSVVAENPRFALPVTDLAAFAGPEQTQEIQRCIKEETHCPFDLANALMIRSRLLRLGERDHVLILVAHHVAADAWSFRLLHEELSALYREIRDGAPAALPKLEIQYGDFALQQRHTLEGPRGAKQMDYWKERLKGELPALDLPTDRPRPTQQNFRGALRFFEYPQHLLEDLKKLARSENMAVHPIALAAFQVLCQRYTRQDDILLGCPISVRNSRETEKLIGYFVNTVVLRCNLSGNPIFQELARQTNADVFGALSHPDVSLERLVEELKVPRQPGRNPLVQVCFQYLTEPLATPQIPGLSAEFLPVDTGTSKFDLTLSMTDGGETLRGEVEYNTDLFDLATVDRIIAHYQTLLESIVANPRQNISSLRLLTTDEEHRLINKWNDTATSFSEAATSLVDLLERQAAATPDGIAALFKDEALTYRELNERANQVARYLRRIGVRSGQLVGICMERSFDLLIAVQGVLKAGAAYFPLDPDYPLERLNYMIRDAQAPVLLCQKRFSRFAPNHSGNVICLDTDWNLIRKESSDNLDAKPGSNDLAYVIYTSGSTGHPKGVMIPHRGICNQLFWMQSRFPLTSDDSILQKTSFSFDVAAWEIFAPVLTGAKLVIAEPGEHRDSAYVARLISERNVTIFQTVPAALRALLDEPEFKNCEQLKYVICGGEEMPVELPQQFRSVSRAQLSNHYGPTECSIDATFWVCSEESHAKIPIGRPVANTEVYLLDANLQLVPAGTPGELCVGGHGLARGYLRRPELTAQKFIPHPFSADPAARLYRTGDLARYDANGNIEFLGRIDHQVKLRGFRIEPGEVETAMRLCPGVRDAAVVSSHNGAGETRLIAYWVAKPNETLSAADLRKFLENQLPQFMVPSAFVPLEALPLTPSGKLDRNALPEPDDRPNLEKFVAPQTHREQELARIWCEVLGVAQVGVHDNFFELGGHSLLAARAVSRVRNVTKTNLGLRDFFQAPTVAGIDAILSRKQFQKTGANLPVLIPLARTKILGLLAGLLHSGALELVYL